jgi:hypothetical protein
MDFLNIKKELSYLEKTGKIDKAVVNTLYSLMDEDELRKIAERIASNG